ncbi:MULTISPECIES: DUF934 domain-containing protein [Cupriavidus]
MLIDQTGSPVEDPWHYWQPGEAAADPLRAVARLGQWEAYVAQAGAGAAGVWMTTDEDSGPVAGMLAGLSLIVIAFPQSRDGRGFTLARLFRERHGFAGDLRAAGPLLPDQFPVLLQCGFTSLLAPPGVPLPRWRDAALQQAQSQSRPRTLLDRLSRGQPPDGQPPDGQEHA